MLSNYTYLLCHNSIHPISCRIKNCRPYSYKKKKQKTNQPIETLCNPPNEPKFFGIYL